MLRPSRLVHVVLLASACGDAGAQTSNTSATNPGPDETTAEPTSGGAPTGSATSMDASTTSPTSTTSGAGTAGETMEDETSSTGDTTDATTDGSSSESSSTGESPLCGNGVVEPGELCDDGNATAYDGCEDTCKPSLLDVQGLGPHTCALLGSGTVRCWGENDLGQLGYGHTERLGDEPGELPTPNVPLAAPVVAIAVQHEFTCALHDDGAVVCWGSNEHGALGQGDLENRGDEPGEMPPPPVPLPGPAVQIATGAHHACALLVTGAVHCWGLNYEGQLGVGHNEDLGDEPGELPGPAAPIGDDVASIHAGAANTCTRHTGGEVRCWGYWGGGILGLATGMGSNLGDDPDELPTPAIDVGGPVDKLSMSSSVCVRIGEELRCWGAGAYGALGAGDSLDRGYFPGDMPPPVVQVGGAVIQHASKDLGTCVLLDTQKVRCWGSQTGLPYAIAPEHLGDEPGEMPPPDAALPGPVAALFRIGGGFVVQMQDGTVRGWGVNDAGQLGLGHTERIGDDELPDSVDPLPVY